MMVSGACVRVDQSRSDRVRNGSLPQNARNVLEVLRKLERPVKAYGLLELLHDKGIHAPMTVYRALDRLIAEGLVRKIESLNAFMALPAFTEMPVAFVICRQCWRTRTEDLDDCTKGWLNSIGADADDSYIEVYSDCYSCSCPTTSE
ncbi:MAG: transcriptional repressor [Pseudomonadota bacterium]